jgi:hypothetical protein
MWEWMYVHFYAFLTSALNGDVLLTTSHSRLTLEGARVPGIHLTWRLGATRSLLDAVEKRKDLLLLKRNEPRFSRHARMYLITILIEVN